MFTVSNFLFYTQSTSMVILGWSRFTETQKILSKPQTHTMIHTLDNDKYMKWLWIINSEAHTSVSRHGAVWSSAWRACQGCERSPAPPLHAAWRTPGARPRWTPPSPAWRPGISAGRTAAAGCLKHAQECHVVKIPATLKVTVYR